MPVISGTAVDLIVQLITINYIRMLSSVIICEQTTTSDNCLLEGNGINNNREVAKAHM